MDGDLLPRCPECGAFMRQANRGLTFKRRGPAYVCPVAERNTVRDRAGNVFRLPGDRHTDLRLWHPDELRDSDWERGRDRRHDERRQPSPSPYFGPERRLADRHKGSRVGVAERQPSLAGR
jgi:hypothetical protein